MVGPRWKAMTLNDVVYRGSCFGIELITPIVEHSKGQIIVRSFDLEGLSQSQKHFVTDKDPQCFAQAI